MKPSKRVEKNIFKTQDGRFGVDICRRCRDENGRPVQRRVQYIVGTSIKEAREARNRDLVKFGGRAYRFAPSGITFGVFTEKYLTRHAAHKRSYARDEHGLRLHLVPFFGHLRLTDISTGLVQEYIGRRRAEMSHRKRLTNPATINREVSLLRCMINRALEWEDIHESPVNWRRIKKLSEPPRDRTLSADEFTRLIAAAGKNPMLRNFLVIALNTGLRRDEILSLRWPDIDLGGRTITVPRGRTKSGKELVIPINETVSSLLSGMGRKSEFVFFNEDTGDRIKCPTRGFRTACRRAGIEGLRIHDLRHTFGSALADAGEGTLAISRLLGHSSEDVTRRYINRMDNRLQGAVDKLNGQFSAERRYPDDTTADETAASDSIN